MLEQTNQHYHTRAEEWRTQGLESMEQSQVVSINPATHIGLVTLRVSNITRALSFYEGVLHFQHKEYAPDSVLLCTEDGQPVLALQELPGAPPQPVRSTGLYHVAILLPARTDLGRVIMSLLEHDWEVGQADHLVSEAIYISDVDGNGLEVYRDRPRSAWPRANGVVQMATDPLDIPGILDETRRNTPTWQVLPVGTTVGHMHLRVGNIQEAGHFYHTILGFDVMVQLPGALFVSAGGYHHHIGMNTWQSRGAGPAPDQTAGLQSYEIVLPDEAARQEVQERLIAHNIPLQQEGESIVIADPWRNQIKLTLAE